MRELTFKPSKTTRVTLSLLFFGVALMFLAGLKDLPPRGLQDWFAIAIAGACLYAAVTYPMRAVVFTDGTVRVRDLGGWRITRLPAKVRVGPGLSLGSIYVIDDATNRVLVILKREFGPIASLEARTKAWMRSENRLVEAES